MVLTRTVLFATHILTLLDQVVTSHKFQLELQWLPWQRTSWKTIAEQRAGDYDCLDLDFVVVQLERGDGPFLIHRMRHEFLFRV